MEAKACKRFDECSVPICPLDEVSMSCATWYPTESYCNSRDYSNLSWVKRQRKISKKVRNKDFYFNYEMLCRDCRITVATEGLDPNRTDISEAQQLNRWFKRHPEIRKLSEQEKTEIARRLNRRLGPFKKEAINRMFYEKKHASTGAFKR